MSHKCCAVMRHVCILLKHIEEVHEVWYNIEVAQKLQNCLMRLYKGLNEIKNERIHMKTLYKL